METPKSEAPGAMHVFGILVLALGGILAFAFALIVKNMDPAWWPLPCLIAAPSVAFGLGLVALDERRRNPASVRQWHRIVGFLCIWVSLGILALTVGPAVMLISDGKIDQSHLLLGLAPSAVIMLLAVTLFVMLGFALMKPPSP